MRSPVLNFEGTEGPTISPTHPGPVAGTTWENRKPHQSVGPPPPWKMGVLLWLPWQGQ